MAEPLTLTIMRALRAAPALEGVTVALDVPSDWHAPGRLILVMRTGGPSNRFYEQAAFAIDMLAPTQLEADTLAASVRSTLMDMDSSPSIAAVGVTGELENPYPTAGGLVPAYQMNITVSHGL